MNRNNEHLFHLNIIQGEKYTKRDLVSNRWQQTSAEEFFVCSAVFHESLTSSEHYCSSFNTPDLTIKQLADFP